MRWYWTVDDGVGPAADVVVDAEPELPVGVLARALELPLAGFAPRAGEDAAVCDAAPESGLTLPHYQLPTTTGQLAVRFRGGPLGGQVVPLARAVTTLGRAEDNDVVVPDPGVSRYQLRIDATGEQVVLDPALDARPVLVNGTPIHLPTPIEAGDLVELGAGVVSVGEAGHVPGDIRRGPAGDLAFNRPSRIRGRQPEPVIALPGPRPEQPLGAPLPWAMATVPVLIGTVMALVLHQPAMLMMGVASPLMVVANYRSQKRFSVQRTRGAVAVWQEQSAQARRMLEAQIAAQREKAWQLWPDPATLREICLGRDARLWERRQDDPDALSVRLGVAERPVSVRIEGTAGTAPPEPYMSPVPVGVDLAQVGVLGIAGPEPTVQAMGRWVLLQLAALRSPRDLRMVLLCERGSWQAWQWAFWLPHLHEDSVGAPAAQIGNTAQSRAERLAELVREIDARLAARREQREARFSSDVVVLLDSVRRYRTETGMTRLLRDGPGVGIFAVCLDEDRVRLPEEVTAELVADHADPTLGLLDVAQQAGVPRLLLDAVSAGIAEEAARAIAPIHHVGGDGEAAVLPDTVRLVDLLGVDLDDPEWVATRWAPGARSTTAVIGAGIDGPFSVDLRLDGPHALVAGTTGAGKSEFLQTLVVSLALVNRPDALTFVLVDYKGASAFADCEQLPHTVGMVTNLDNRETERALTSLDAELLRREQALKELGARDVDEAWDRDPRAAAANRLARLVLVIDEFAELVHELPDFVTGLIRIARVGRSLGVHLVLATQRPAGVVSAEMQANLGLRVALRMADKENSSEVLGAPDAAYIASSTPGRGYVRRVSGTAPAGFQTARVAGRRPGQHAATSRPPRVRRVSWDNVGEAIPPAPRVGGDDPDATDLHALVDSIRAASRQLAVPTNPSPWLPPLPTLITLDELTVSFEHDEAGLLLGLLDVPERQAQLALRYRIGQGHVLVVGAARSGRSTVLRTIAAEVAGRCSPEDVHLYGVDFGGSALLPMRDLPHCGAVITGTETDRVVRLLSRLTDEITQRQLVLARDGLGDIAEQRAQASPADALPHILVLVDRWEGFLSAFPLEEAQSLRERVIKILREGPAAGASLIITGDRAVLTDRIAAFVETRYTLRQSDREDYRLAGIRPSALPEHVPPGRGYFGDPIQEVHFASVSADPSGQAQAGALREIVARAREQSAEMRVRPFRLDVLPVRIELSEAAALPAVGAANVAGASLLMGVGGDDLSGFHVELSAGPGLLVAGPRRSGRSTALAAAAAGLLAQGFPVLVVAPRPSPAAGFAEHHGLDLVTDTGAETAGRVTAWVQGRQRCAVVVDDAELVHGSELDNELIELARNRPPGTFVLAVAAVLDELGALLRGVAVEAKRHKQGLLLSPSSSLEGNLLGPGLPRTLLGRAPAGRGVLPVDGAWVAVQVPVPDQGGSAAS